jgi:hypothetical protein
VAFTDRSVWIERIQRLAEARLLHLLEKVYWSIGFSRLIRSMFCRRSGSAIVA